MLVIFNGFAWHSENAKTSGNSERGRHTSTVAIWISRNIESHLYRTHFNITLGYCIFCHEDFSMALL